VNGTIGTSSTYSPTGIRKDIRIREPAEDQVYRVRRRDRAERGAGNVSWRPPRRSSGAVSPVRHQAKFQLGPLTLTALASQRKRPELKRSRYGRCAGAYLRDAGVEYATTMSSGPALRPYYEPYYQNEPPQISRPELQIVEAEVWVQRSGIIPDPNERQAIAFILFRRILRRPMTAAQCPATLGTWKRVRWSNSTDRSTSLTGRYIGELSSTSTCPTSNRGDRLQTPDRAVRRAARTVGIADTSLHKSLISENGKPKNLLSNGGRTMWLEQLLQNISPIPGSDGTESRIQLDVFRQVPGSQDQNSILMNPTPA